MNDQELRKRTQGLLSGIGFSLKKAADGRYEIQNRSGSAIVRGDLQTVYYCAAFMSGDAKRNPEKYEKLNMPVDQNKMYQAGLAMSKKLKQG